MKRSHPLGSGLPDTPAYGGHSVYLFSTLDNPTEESRRSPSPILSPNSKRQKTDDGSPLARPSISITGDAPSTDGGAPSNEGDGDVQMDESGDQEEREEEGDQEEDDNETKYSEVPVVLPRRSFNGISNLRTIKDGASVADW